MNIAQVTPVDSPHRGGRGQVAYEYTERLRRRGHAVQVFTPSYQRVEHDPPFVHRMPSLLRAGNAAFTPALYHRLRGFDLVHLHYPFFGGAEPTVTRKAIKGDYVLMLSYYMDAVAGGAKGIVFDAHRRLLQPWILSHADRVLVSSIDYAQTSALADVKGVLERVEAHPFGVDVDQFHPGEEPALRTSLGIPRHEPAMVFVGGLDSVHFVGNVSDDVLLGTTASPISTCSRPLREQKRSGLSRSRPRRPAFPRSPRTFPECAPLSWTVKPVCMCLQTIQPSFSNPSARLS